MTKTCTRCNTALPLGEFYTNGQGYMFGHCRQCHAKPTPAKLGLDGWLRVVEPTEDELRVVRRAVVMIQACERGGTAPYEQTAGYMMARAIPGRRGDRMMHLAIEMAKQQRGGVSLTSKRNAARTEQRRQKREAA